MSRPHTAFVLASLGCIVSALAQSPAPVPAEPKPAPTSLYLTALQDLRTTFGLDAEGFLELPPYEDPATDRFGPEWDDVRVRAAKELATFAQAARLPDADFGVGRDSTEIGYDVARSQLFQLMRLTAAQGWHHVGAKQPGAAAHDAVTLLQHALHLGKQASAFACNAGFTAERLAAALLREIGRADGGLDAATIDRLRKQLDDHLQRRTGRLQFVAAVQQELRRQLTGVRAAATSTNPAPDERTKADPTEQLIAARGNAIADRIEQIVDAWLAPLRREGDIDLAAALGEVDGMIKAARKTANPNRLTKQLPSMSADQAVEAVATVYAVMMCPPIRGLLQEEAHAATELKACRQLLGAAPAKK